MRKVYRRISRKNKLADAHTQRRFIRHYGQEVIKSIYNKHKFNKLGYGYRDLEYFIPKRFQYSSESKPICAKFYNGQRDEWPLLSVNYVCGVRYEIKCVSKTAMFTHEAPYKFNDWYTSIGKSVYHSLYVKTTIEHIYKLVSRLPIKDIILKIHTKFHNTRNLETFTVEEFQDMIV